MKRKKMMDYYFETCSIESGFREVMDNRQMGKDFWLFDFAKQLDFCTLQRPQKIKLLQLLLDAFSVNNPMTAEEYYKVMNENDDYYRYMIHCFSVDTKDSAVFWRIWGAMSGNDSERIDMMMEYTKAHTKFMIQLEEYLRRMFPGRGFGGHMQKYITKLVNYIANAMSDGSDAASNANYLVNPIFPCDLK